MNEHFEFERAEPCPQRRFPVFYVIFRITFMHSAAPAQALAAGRPHRFGLFVIKNGVFVKTYFYLFLRTVYGEFDIFGHGMIRPAAQLFDQLHGDIKSRSRHIRPQPQHASGMVNERAFTVKHIGRAGGDPIRRNVFGRPVRSRNGIAFVEQLIHFRSITGIQKVVGVEDKDGFKLFGPVIFHDPFQRIIQSVAFPFLGRYAFEYDRASFPRDLRRRVRAIVGADEYPHEPGRVLLRFYAVDQIADDLFLVVRAYQISVFMLRFGRAVPFYFRYQPAYGIKILMKISDKRDTGNDSVHNQQNFQKHIRPDGKPAENNF